MKMKRGGIVEKEIEKDESPTVELMMKRGWVVQDKS